MNNKIKILNIIACVVFTMCFVIPAVKAQGPGFPSTPVDTPFDGGVSLIAVAAVGYGIKKLQNRKNK